MIRTLLPKRWRMAGTIFWSASTVPSLASRLQSRNLAKSEMLPRKAVQRQVAIGTIISVKIGALLAAMERIVGRIKIQHDLGTLAWNGFDSTLDEQLLDLVGLRLDLVVTSVDGLCA